MVAAPWRIARAVYPWRPATWPVPDRTRDDVLLDCRSYLAAARTLATPWGFDANRLIALEQAEAALIAMATAESDPSRRAGRDACRDLGAACARPADDA